MNPVVFLGKNASLRGLQACARGCTRPAYVFLGVPFAEPPQRFAAPQTLKLWEGERDATRFGAVCPQNSKALKAMMSPYETPEEMSEDCLFLNIWSPTLDVNAKRPVMVWIHGGAYISGCSNCFDGTAYACLHDVVFVSINYRLGILGFMCTGDGVVPGNMGLLDQREALRWIQSYIRCFGGDPTNVTVFGQSAGAMSISCHMVSPQSFGLFHRAILQSGSVCYYKGAITAAMARRRLYAIVEKLGGKHIHSGKDVVQFLDGHRLDGLIEHPAFSLSYPVIDGNFLSDHPMYLYDSGQCAQVDAIFGFNTDEGYEFFMEYYRAHPGLLTVGKAQEVLKAIIHEKYFAHHCNADEIYTAVCHQFLDGVADSEVLLQRLSQIWGDIIMTVPCIYNAVKHVEAAGGRNTYVYHFDHRPSFSVSPDWVTANHGYEIPFALGEPFLERFPDIWTPDETQLSRTMMTFWSDFAKHGNPNSSAVGIEWPQFHSVNGQYIVLRTPPQASHSYGKQQMQFWLNDVGSLCPPTTTSPTEDASKL